MAPRRNVPLIALALDRAAPEPMHRQLYSQVRDAVLSGRLAAGSRLPSSRRLAREVACSRNTVVNAFEQLLSEGYLEGRTGAGTWASRLRASSRWPMPRPSRCCCTESSRRTGSRAGT